VIPYVTVPALEVGPFTFRVFGLLIVSGIVLNWYIFRRVRAAWRLDEQVAEAVFYASVGVGFVAAHLFSVLAYRPQQVVDNPLRLFIPSGISSVGGFIGGVVGYLLVMRWYRDRVTSRLRYTDLAGLGLVPGHFLGRIGCALAHDHPGHLTDFFLAVDFPGGARHDLGLYEAALEIPLLIFLYVANRRPRPAGFFTGWIALLYGLGRFLLDFLRATDLPRADVRYFGLTPAQYVCAAFFVTGLVILMRAYRGPEPPPGGT
jgi:phosphatidylglycerol---prolipoprotein diacylglyceryl transferase